MLRPRIGAHGFGFRLIVCRLRGAYGAPMTDATRCPHCGRPGDSPLESLYREVARIREIAESRDGGQNARPAPRALAAADAGDQSVHSAARIAELTREVHELRATVARLRGSAMPGLARSL